MLPFMTQYQPSVSPIKDSFAKVLKNHQSFPYKKGKSLKDMLLRAGIDVWPITPCIFSHNRFESILAIIPAGCVLYNTCGQLSR